MILLAALLAAVVSTPTSSVTFCVAGECRPPDVARAEGVAPDAARALHELTAVTSDGARNVAPSFELRCGANVWTWTMPQLPRQPIEIAHPAGTCTLAIRAAGYKTAEQELGARKVGVVHLYRLPVIRGRITDAVTGTPVAHAQILLPGGDPLTTSDDNGRYRVVVDGIWPSRLRVEAPGRATRTIDVPKAVADADLDVALSRGGAIAVKLAGAAAVRWELRRIVREIDDEPVRSGTIEAGESFVTVDGVDPGDYRFVVMGERPLQCAAVPVVVSEGALAEASLQVKPVPLKLEVVRGGKPFPNAELSIAFRGDGKAAWRAKLAADEHGRASEELWQHGRYSAYVAGSSFSEERLLDSEDGTSWTLDVPDRVIRGRVTDAATKRPIAEAPVLLDLRDDEGRVMQRALSGADGTFEFRMVPAGTYSLAARPQGYVEMKTPPAALAEETLVETRDLALSAVTGHTLRVVSAAGVPMRAHVWISTRNGTREVGVTREDGRITLPLAYDEYGHAYAVPLSGSFAATRFASIAEEGMQELAVTVPDGTASLEMLTQSTSGEPIASVPFIMRVNGVLLPGRVYEAMVRVQGAPLRSDAAGRVLLSRLPPGHYEVWPMEMDVASAAPVNVTLTPGHHVAKMTFKPKA